MNHHTPRFDQSHSFEYAFELSCSSSSTRRYVFWVLPASVNMLSFIWKCVFEKRMCNMYMEAQNKDMKAGSETGLDEGKMSHRIQFQCFLSSPNEQMQGAGQNANRHSRLSQRICLYSRLNPCCRGPRHCHFACKISISAGTSCFTWRGCLISETCKATFWDRSRHKEDFFLRCDFSLTASADIAQDWVALQCESCCGLSMFGRFPAVKLITYYIFSFIVLGPNKNKVGPGRLWSSGVNVAPGVGQFNSTCSNRLYGHRFRGVQLFTSESFSYLSQPNSPFSSAVNRPRLLPSGYDSKILFHLRNVFDE